jgi:Arc/MetJ-type ribon-helix-helix transcriptional regulator
MRITQIGVKVEASLKQRIIDQIDGKKYRDISDFVVRAIYEKLDREEMDERTRFKLMMIDLIKTDPEIQTLIHPKKSKSI